MKKNNIKRKARTRAIELYHSSSPFRQKIVKDKTKYNRKKKHKKR